LFASPKQSKPENINKVTLIFITRKVKEIKMYRNKTEMIRRLLYKGKERKMACSEVSSGMFRGVIRHVSTNEAKIRNAKKACFRN
jgi:hypothetical protein